MLIDVKSIFDYQSEDGELLWKHGNGRKIVAGSIAGSITDAGYIRIVYNGIKYRAHRLVWFWHYGEMPNDPIDHINGIRQDNRIENLRLSNAVHNKFHAVMDRGSQYIREVDGRYVVSPSFKTKEKAAIARDLLLTMDRE